MHSVTASQASVRCSTAQPGIDMKCSGNGNICILLETMCSLATSVSLAEAIVSRAQLHKTKDIGDKDRSQASVWGYVRDRSETLGDIEFEILEYSDYSCATRS